MHIYSILVGKKKIDIWNWCISGNIHLSVPYVAGLLNMEAHELSRKLNDALEWDLDVNIFHEIVVRFGYQTLTFLHQGSIINLISIFHLDQNLMQWW